MTSCRDTKLQDQILALEAAHDLQFPGTAPQALHQTEGCQHPISTLPHTAPPITQFQFRASIALDSRDGTTASSPQGDSGSGFLIHPLDLLSNPTGSISHLHHHPDRVGVYHPTREPVMRQVYQPYHCRGKPPPGKHKSLQKLEHVKSLAKRRGPMVSQYARI